MIAWPAPDVLTGCYGVDNCRFGSGVPMSGNWQ